MARTNATGNNNENPRPTREKDHLSSAENATKDNGKEAAGTPPEQNWFSSVFKKTAFTIWAIVMIVGVTLAFIASLLLL